MFRLVVSAVLLAVAFCGLDVSAQATRNTGERKWGAAEVAHMELKGRVMLAPYVTGGLLTGEVVDSIKRYDDDLWRRSVYGLGISGDWGVSHHARLGLRLEFLWAKPAEWDEAQARMWSLAGNAMILAKPHSSQTAYVRGELGVGSVSFPNLEDGDAGSHLLTRVGLGLQTFVAATWAARTELYYRWIFTEGYDDPPSYWRGEVPFDVMHFGFEIAMAFGL